MIHETSAYRKIFKGNRGCWMFDMSQFMEVILWEVNIPFKYNKQDACAEHYNLISPYGKGELDS